MKCECGKELKKITRKHLESEYHLKNLVNTNILKDMNEIENEIVQNAVDSGLNLDDLNKDVKNKILKTDNISKINTDDNLFKSNLNDNKFDIKGKYIISRNNRPKFKRIPKRLLIIFYDRESKNAYTISDYNTSPIVIVDNRIFFLDKVFYINEGIPAYAIVLNTIHSIEIIFNENNDKLLESQLDPSTVLMYVNSIAVKYLYDDKERKLKYTWYHFVINVFSTGFFVVLALIIQYAILKI